MSADTETETIGSLIFKSNPNYPYPFRVEQPPRFWMEEQTGVLEQAVEAYMNGEKLESAQLDVLHLYLTQYITRAVLANGTNRQKLLERIPRLRTYREIEEFADFVSECGAEIF